MLGPAARTVDILDPEQESPPGRPRQIERAHRRQPVPEMQPPGGRGREAGHHFHA